jgi:hypothetical protein
MIFLEVQRILLESFPAKPVSLHAKEECAYNVRGKWTEDRNLFLRDLIMTRRVSK